MPSSNKINNVWGSNRAEVELECPSGQFCLVKKPNPEQLMMLGIIDKVDILSKLVDTKHVKRVKGKPSSTPVKVDVEALSKNPKNAIEIMALADKVVEAVVIEPSVRRPVKLGGPDGDKEFPLPHGEREEGQIYTDMIDFMDRMYIFQHAVGGDVSLESFRKQLALPVAGVADGVEVSKSTVKLPGD